jgi:uncharacterized damage-inducible protein DinB
MKRIVALLLGAATMLGMASARELKDEPPKQPTIAEQVLGPWKLVEGQFTAAAEAMPVEKYGFAPKQGAFEGVRTFAEQVKHVACANFGFFDEMEGKTPPPDCEHGGPDPANTKEELVRYLKDSFAYGDRVLAKLDCKNALDKAEGRYGGPSTKLGIATLAVWHSSDHYGQIVLYLRMNGIVPPASR